MGLTKIFQTDSGTRQSLQDQAPEKKKYGLSCLDSIGGNIFGDILSLWEFLFIQIYFTNMVICKVSYANDNKEKTYAC